RAALAEVHLLPDVETESLRVRACVPEQSGDMTQFSRTELGSCPRIASGCALRLAVSPADGSGAVVTCELSVSEGLVQGGIAIPGPRLWSPDDPQLYCVEIELVDGDTTLDAMVERTGFVKLSTEGSCFLINGEPYYIRGTGDFLSCPETGCPDTDRDRWRRKLQALRDYGYNQVRCQSYVYAPEYFEAADEVGLLIQSEMGMLGAWGGHNQYHVYAWPAPTPDQYPTLKRQWDLVVRRDVSHPSAAIYCMSNELGGSTFFPRIAWRCYHDTKAIKPQAMVIWTDGGYNADLPGDFVNTNWPEGQPSPDKPVTEHEFRWWSSFPDVRLAEKYCGAVRHYTGNLAREVARRRGQEHLLETYAENSQRLQFLEAKTKMEQLRRDRAFLAGVSHFNAMDANPSPQGVITEFYARKLVDAETWRQANDDTVILSSLDFDNRVLTAGEVFRCTLHVSDFSHPPFAEPLLRWRLHGETGEMRWQHEPFTTCRIGEVECVVPPARSPARIELHAEMSDGARTVTNAWSLWVFPETRALSGVVRYGALGHTWIAAWDELPTVGAANLPADGVVLTEGLDEALLAHLDGGGTVLLAAGEGLVRPHAPNFGYVRYFFTPPANYGPFEDGQNGTVIRDHPLLGDFPHEGFADLPFFRMMDCAPPLALEPLGLNDEDPIIRVIHRYPVLHPLGYLVERSCGAGRLIVSALDLQPSWPEARYLLSCLCRGAGQAPARPFDPRLLPCL
ncbi:MAG: hypothetical protein FJX75_27810, partial [Armatimonadetes bacterium]|nr:hypothetical protein [Armatimonadota bacterium]